MGELWVGVLGARLFVRAWGKSGGQPLLSWHGVGLTSRASLFMNEAGPLLASRHGLQVLALDAPGFGRSPPSERRDYHPHVLVDLVPPLLDALGLARVAFMGFRGAATSAAILPSATRTASPRSFSSTPDTATLRLILP